MPRSRRPAAPPGRRRSAYLLFSFSRSTFFLRIGSFLLSFSFFLSTTGLTSFPNQESHGPGIAPLDRRKPGICQV